MFQTLGMAKQFTWMTCVQPVLFYAQNQVPTQEQQVHTYDRKPVRTAGRQTPSSDRKQAP